MAKADYYTVLQSFVANLGDRTELYREGEIVDSSDPAFKKSPQLFGPLQVRGAAPVATPVSEPEPEPEPEPAPEPERASAAPGEQRQGTGKAITTSGLKGR